MEQFYLVQVKRTNGTIEKGVVVKDTFDEAKQSFHAYLGAYAFGKDDKTDYVMCEVLDGRGLGLLGEYWEKPTVEVAEEE